MQSLTAIQLQVIEALSSGLSVTAAADAAGLHRTTVHHWSRNIPEFRDTLAATKQAHIDIHRDAMNSLAEPSIAILRNIIQDESASPALRVRTALAIIKFVTTPEKSTLPQSNPEEMNRIEAAYSAGYRAALHAAEAPAPPEDEIHHNSSLSTPDEFVDESTHQTPRNAMCPCGSKLKYKRCCGKNAPPVLGRAA
ncbi:MAG: SEC-C metal-binding domain-containing protein [Bryobacteraceae bacterium]